MSTRLTPAQRARLTKIAERPSSKNATRGAVTDNALLERGLVEWRSVPVEGTTLTTRLLAITEAGQEALR